MPNYIVYVSLRVLWEPMALQGSLPRSTEICTFQRFRLSTEISSFGLRLLSHPTHDVLPMATGPEPHSALALSQFFEFAELEPGLVFDLVDRLASDHWETTPQWHSLFWPLLTADHNINSSVDNIAAQVIRLRPGTNEAQDNHGVIS